MEFGVGFFPTHDAIGPGPLAGLVESYGQDALFFADHTHIPASRLTPPPRGGELPQKFWHTYDLFVALTAAAVASTSLRIGSGVCLLVERDPIITAKQVASIDDLSGGRMEFGVGAGWNREEMRNHGTDPRTRMRLLAERVEAIHQIWTADEATFKGEFVNFERIWSWPKPVQHPHPPILVGGNGPTVIDRVLACGDAWFPSYAPDGLADRVRELRARAERPIGFQTISVPADPKVLDDLAALGCARAVHWLPSGNRSDVEAALTRWDVAITEFSGRS
jgi:probable F420-dependent oxidoreductase